MDSIRHQTMGGLLLHSLRGDHYDPWKETISIKGSRRVLSSLMALHQILWLEVAQFRLIESPVCFVWYCLIHPSFGMVYPKFGWSLLIPIVGLTSGGSESSVGYPLVN
jgi:hypothetical protein